MSCSAVYEFLRQAMEPLDVNLDHVDQRITNTQSRAVSIRSVVWCPVSGHRYRAHKNCPRTIVDGHPTNKAKLVKQFLATTDGTLKIFVLPPTPRS